MRSAAPAAVWRKVSYQAITAYPYTSLQPHHTKLIACDVLQVEEEFCEFLKVKSLHSSRVGV
jgi:hypothetical protein